MKETGLSRLFLHAYWLEFDLPGVDDRVQVTTPLPDELSLVLSNLE